jgi:hypothetical protein
MHPTLKAQSSYSFDYSDLEKLISELYGQNIDILDLLFEPNNDSYEEYEVDGDSELYDIGDPEIVAEWIQTGAMPYRDDYRGMPLKALDVRHILHRLHAEGHIPTGKYIMRISW